MVDLLKLADKQEKAHYEAKQREQYRQSWQSHFVGHIPYILVTALICAALVGVRLLLQGYELPQLTAQLLILAIAALIWSTFLGVVDARFDFENRLLGRKRPILWGFVAKIVFAFAIIGFITYALGIHPNIQPYDQQLVTTDSTFRWAMIGAIDGTAFGLLIAGVVSDLHTSEYVNTTCLGIVMSLVLIALVIWFVSLDRSMSVVLPSLLSLPWISYYWPERKPFQLPTA